MNIINHFTLQTLKRNKVRTIVTIIGIILSTAMFTAVTSIVVSMQKYLADTETEAGGAWHGRLSGLNQKVAGQFLEKEEVSGGTLIQNVGYARMEESVNEFKPYLCIESIQGNFIDFSPIRLIKGRMPENSGELLLSAHLSDNGHVEYEVGDILHLKVGKREDGEGSVLGQDNAFQEGEKLTGTEKRVYKVVGICERPEFENFEAPGFTGFTAGEQEDAYSCDILFTFYRPTKLDEVVNQFLNEEEGDGVVYSIHSELLRLIGQTPNNHYMQTLYGMGAILIFIIVAASISLIYNAFSISVSERVQQFGLLKSIGATKKQIRRSVLFEAGFLCLIGIPLGIGSGLLGIGITLRFVGELMSEVGGLLVEESSGVSLKLYIAWHAILLAAVLAFVTVILSAMLPARRAIKIPPIDAIRQSNEIKGGRRIRSSRLVYRLFGFEGMLANKNFKRNRRKYRLTVISLALSVILFLSASSFSSYLLRTMEMAEDDTGYDITFSSMEKDFGENTLSAVEQSLGTLGHIEDVAYQKYVPGFAHVDFDSVDKEYLGYLRTNAPGQVDEEGKKVLLDTRIFYVSENHYRHYLEGYHLDTAKFLDAKNPSALVWDQFFTMTEDGKAQSFHLLGEDGFSGSLYALRSTNEFDYNGEVLDSKNLVFSFNQYDLEDRDGKVKTVELPKKKALVAVPVSDVQKMSGRLPLPVSDERWVGTLMVVLPYSAVDHLPQDLSYLENVRFGIQAAEHKQATAELVDFFKHSEGYSVNIISGIYDVRESADEQWALVMVINIFAYGFITLITLIVIANVFNTVSTNIQLRRKEFAMLKSVGMTRKGFDRMMNYECILYGVKGLLFGLPIAFVLCYLMWRSMLNSMEMAFYVPWGSVLAVGISVFLVVFVSMLYSMGKMKKDNPIEALRNDNI